MLPILQATNRQMPTGGEIRIGGKAVSGYGQDRGVVFQDFAQLFPWRTALGNVSFGLEMKGEEVGFPGVAVVLGEDGVHALLEVDFGLHVSERPASSTAEGGRTFDMPSPPAPEGSGMPR